MATPDAHLSVASMAGSRSDRVTDPVIVLAAHQDDETLTFGPIIEAETRPVICVLLTDGSSSSVRDALGLTYEQFSAARDREYLAACRALGVSQVYAEGARDGQLSLAFARAVAAKWVTRYPAASFKVQSFLDSHDDHANIGRAFRELWNDNAGLDVRYGVKREDLDYHRDQVAAGVPSITGGARTVAACDAYAYRNTAQGRYGIGQRSVPETFDALRADRRTWYYRPF